ncbi:MAG: aspartate 1-decarboxylase [Anaerovoracaceae bacterium]
MEVTMLKGKIHRATVKQSELDYVGSITIDEDLLDAAGILEYQRVEVADVNNGVRFATYAIAGERGSGMICLNGATARCAAVGDLVIIMAYAEMSVEEAAQHKPKVVLLDRNNSITKVTAYEKHGLLTEEL